MFKWFAFICVLCLWGCDLPWKKSDPVVASVGKTELKLSELKLLRPDWDQTSERQRLQMLETWVTQEALYQEALVRGLDQDPETKRILDFSRKKIILDRLASKITDTLQMTENEVQHYYEAHPEYFLRTQSLYTGAIFRYADTKTATRVFRELKSQNMNALPPIDSNSVKITRFDSLKTSPDPCIAEDLSALAVGKLTPPRSCKGFFKSMVIFSSLDSGSVKPLVEVFSFAENLARGDKRNEKMKNFKIETKNKRAIFTYPDYFCGPGKE